MATYTPNTADYGTSTNPVTGQNSPGVTYNAPDAQNPYGTATTAAPAAVPTPASSGTGTTGVATSGLAKSTLGQIQSGTQGIQQAVAQHAAAKASVPSFDPNSSVVDLLASKGMPSDYSSRASMAQQAGIKNYVGSAQQNQQLMGYVNSGGTGQNVQGQATTSASAQGSSAPATANGTAQNVQSSSSSNQQNIFQNTGQPGDADNAALNQTFSQLGQASDDIQQKLTSIQNGTFPLTAAQQQQIQASQQQFSQLAQLQMTANQSYQNAAALQANRSGEAIQDPQEAQADQLQTISDGLNKINSLDAEATKTLGALTSAFMQQDETAQMDNYKILSDTLNAKAAAIEKNQDDINSAYQFNQNLNEKYAEMNQTEKNFLATQQQTQNTAIAKVAPALGQLAGLDLSATVKSGLGSVGMGFLTGAKNKEIPSAFGPNVTVANSPSTTNASVYEGIASQIAAETNTPVWQAKQTIYNQYPQFATYDYQQAIQNPDTSASMESLTKANPGASYAQLLYALNNPPANQ